MSRILVLGLDSADAELVERWSDEGHLPTFASLRRDGLWSRLATTAEVMHVSAWPTLYTGARPGLHGMYHAYQIRAGEQEIHRTLAHQMALPPFWKLLDDAGKRCIVLDAFMDSPQDLRNGWQVLEYGTWTWFGRPGSTPRSLRREIVRRFGPYPAPEHTQVLTVPEPAEFRDRLVEGARVKGEVARWLLVEKPWDLAFITFGEPHGAGHYLWHWGDADHPAHPSVPRTDVSHALRDVYAAVDEALGRILEVVDDDVTVFVVSGDGMGPNWAGCHLIPDLLHELDLFHSASVGKWREERVQDEDPRTGSRGHPIPRPGVPVGSRGGEGERSGPRPRKGLASMVREAIPLPLRRTISRCMPRSLHYALSMRWVNAGIDWERSSVFAIPNANEGYLRLNLQGREPKGIVSPGLPRERLLDDLAGEMEGLMNPATGRSAVHRVYHMDATFPGALRGNLPDLVVTWSPEARVLGHLRAPSAEVDTGRANYQVAPYYTGNHRPNAFVGARGPHVAPGGIPEEGHILDLAPTVLAALGVEAPSHFEGRAWAQLVGAAV